MAEAPRYSWTQPCCEDCWTKNNPGREATRLVRRLEETCVYCEEKTASGIYVRVDPALASFPTLEKD